MSPNNPAFTMVIIVYLLFIALILGGLVWLQVKLSKMENPLFSAIIPGIFLLASVTRLSFTYAGIARISQNMHGRMMSFNYNTPSLLTIIFEFLVLNIPTLIFVLITVYVKDQQRRNNELKKMMVKDL